MLDLTSGTVDKSISFVADASGDWYAVVSGYDGAYDITSQYYIAAEVRNPTPTPTPCQPGRLEPNNSEQQARLWAWPYTSFITTTLSICVGDEDWFGVRLGTQDTLWAQIGFRHAEGDLMVTLRQQAKIPWGATSRSFAIIGVVKPYVSTWCGVARVGSRAALVQTSWKRQWCTAHELGHAVGGLNHVIGCLADSPFEEYPYKVGWLSAGGDRDHYGLDTGSNPPRIKLPSANADIMTYCRPEWISDYQ